MVWNTGRKNRKLCKKNVINEKIRQFQYPWTHFWYSGIHRTVIHCWFDTVSLSIQNPVAQIQQQGFTILGLEEVKINPFPIT